MNLDTVLKLADTPLEDAYLRVDKFNTEQPTFPLELAKCSNCGYVFLPYVVYPEISYSNYVYKSSITVGLGEHYKDYVKSLILEYSIPANELAVDIGSNDGLMLRAFKAGELEPIGVEPAPAIANHSNSQGFLTINSYFDFKVKNQIEQNYGRARLITANYMFANVDDLSDFLNNVKGLLNSEGLFVVQTGYHPDQFRGMMFDYIYHEHFSYFTLNVLIKLFDLADLQIINAHKVSPKGGSLRVVAQIKGGKYPVSYNVDKICQEENNEDKDFFKNFDLKINLSRDRIISLLTEIKSSNKSIVGFGASHSTTTLLYHFKLAPYLDYLVDDNIAKHGTFSPGVHIPVYPFEKIYESPPDYILILAWQHAESIKSRHTDYLSNGGAWIVPLPDLQVIKTK
ncbi:class I SAM-dependent methyltransferase [Polynucleobacter sp. IMCC30063]|nr:class I SAM-dependent methyltransferase [Polynucleobacter sp. IMCC30063]